MEDRFILPRKVYASKEKYPVMRVSRNTYDTAVRLASESGLSLATVMEKSLEYAVAHLVYIDEIKIEEAPEK